MDYEECLKRAHAEGWRNPVEVTDLEIKAYEAGVLMERKRVTAILNDIEEGPPMRFLDVWHYILKIKNPSNSV